MKQSSLDLSLSVKKTHKREFPGEMDAVVPWAALVQLIAPYYPEGRNGRAPFALETMLRVHFLQQWFTVKGTAGHVHDINEGNALLHGQEQMVFADAGYRGIEKRPDVTSQVRWHVAMRPGQRKALDKNNAADALLDAAEKLKAGVRAKVEHPFRVIKRQFGYVKVRYRGLKKNTQQLITLFALSNLWMARGQLMRISA